jgi:molecular chaperone DnaK (HSP70)
MFIVGIDLGTTHSAVAWVNPALGPQAPIVDLPIPQLFRPGELTARRLLPSCVYLPAEGELPEGSVNLPWPSDPKRLVGELARWQSAQVPTRGVASAKSWLCHPGVDRQAAILPWGAPSEVSKISPVEASALILRHLMAAFALAQPDAPLAAQEVVITVPASFDEAARALTVSAAKQAGLERFTLLEEPQAALYDFTARHRTDLARALSGVRLALVVDVGGGTTDFTLVQVETLPEGPALKRIAVGDHLMLGGDNMDAALAHHLEQTVTSQGKRLSPSQWVQLVQGARRAKETLLGDKPPQKHALAVAAGGSRLLGGALSFELTREVAESAIVEGFFPRCEPEAVPRRQSRMAIQELGLPYAQDPAITRHCVAFLREHARAGHEALGADAATPGLPRPDAVLLNGGVFNSPVLTERLVDALSALWPDRPRIPLLHHDSLDLAVARGAAYFGLTRRGLGRRISGGAARAYYVALDSTSPDAQVSGVCLIPRGFEEGTSVQLKGQPFLLTLGRPVSFQLFSTSSDRIDVSGALVPLADEAFRPLPPIHTVLRSGAGRTGEVPVHLEASLTDIGTLELWCVSQAVDERWRLEFELRGQATRPVSVTESMPARFGEARENVQRVYGHKPLPVGPKDVKQLSKTLEKTLGPRETWRLPVLRELWGTLFAGASKRRRTEDHERVFFQLTGYCLRPGFGQPLDEWRAEQTFTLFKDSVQFHAEKPNWNEFWVMWRRVSGGLSESAQQHLWSTLRPHLERKLGIVAPGKERLKGVQPEGLDEMIRCAASLEHLDAETKVELGTWIAQKLRDPATQGGPWAWALGRLGARVPVYGSGHRVVPAEVASTWLSLLLELGLPRIDGAPFAAAQLARLSGDRTRDLTDDERRQCMDGLQAAKAAPSWIQMVREATVLDAADEARALGDTLPAGLKLSA